MTKPVVAGIAAFVVFFVSLQFTSRLGRGDSTDPEHVALQTSQPNRQQARTAQAPKALRMARLIF